MGFKDKLTAFFYGRYGIDQFYKFMMGVWVVLMVAQMFMSSFVPNSIVSYLLSLLTLALVVYMFFRVMSKNTAKRRAENDAYLRIKNKVIGWFKLTVRRFKERKTHSFKKCPHCKTTVRLQKRSGKHTARCPVCGGTFEVKFK